MAKSRGGGKRRGAVGGGGYNPYRSGDGRFGSGAHKRVSKAKDRVAKLKQKSLKLRDKMRDIKARAKNVTPEKRKKLRERFDKLKSSRDKLRSEIKDGRGAVKSAKQKHADAKRKERDARKVERAERAKGRAERAESRAAGKKERDARRRVREGDRKRLDEINEGLRKQKEDVDRRRREDQEKDSAHKREKEQNIRVARERIARMSPEERAVHDEMTRHREEAEAHFAVGRLHQGRLSVEKMVEASGMHKRPDEEGTTTIASTLGKSEHGLVMGSRGWDGTITMSSDMESQIRGFGKDMTERRKSGVSSLDDAPGMDSNKSYGMHVMIHEVIHGYGPTHAAAYMDKGAIIEEITTEISTRRIMSTHYGSDMRVGSYNKYMNRVMMAVHKHRGVDFDTADRIVEETSLGFKKTPAFHVNGRAVGTPTGIFFSMLGPGKLTLQEFEDML